jgi:hypothetical protein
MNPSAGGNAKEADMSNPSLYGNRALIRIGAAETGMGDPTGCYLFSFPVWYAEMTVKNRSRVEGRPA